MEITISGLGGLTIPQLFGWLVSKVIREDNLGTVSHFDNGNEIRSYHYEEGATAISAICSPDRIYIKLEHARRTLELTKERDGDRILIYAPLCGVMFDQVAML